MRKIKKISLWVFSTVALALSLYLIFSTWFSMENEVEIPIDRTIETELASKNVSVKYLLNEFSGPKNFDDTENIIIIPTKEIFLLLTGKTNVKEIFYAFEEKTYYDGLFLTKKYWTPLEEANGVLKFEQVYAVKHKEDYLIGEYNEERVIFQKKVTESFLEAVVLFLGVGAFSLLAIYTVLSFLECIALGIIWLVNIFKPRKE